MNFLAEISMARCQHDKFLKHFFPRVFIFMSSWMSKMQYNCHLIDCMKNSWLRLRHCLICWEVKSGETLFAVVRATSYFTYVYPQPILRFSLNLKFITFNYLFSKNPFEAVHFLNLDIEYWWSIMPMAAHMVWFWREISKPFTHRAWGFTSFLPLYIHFTLILQSK